MSQRTLSVREVTAVKSELWTQLAELCGVREETPERLAQFLAILENINAFDAAVTFEIVSEAAERAAAFEARLRGDDFNRGMIAAARVFCEAQGAPLPAWAQELDREIQARWAALHAELALGTRKSGVPASLAVH